MRRSRPTNMGLHSSTIQLNIRGYTGWFQCFSDIKRLNFITKVDEYESQPTIPAARPRPRTPAARPRTRAFQAFPFQLK